MLDGVAVSGSTPDTRCLSDPASIPKVADQHQVSVMLTVNSESVTGQQS